MPRFDIAYHVVSGQKYIDHIETDSIEEAEAEVNQRMSRAQVRITRPGICQLVPVAQIEAVEIRAPGSQLPTGQGNMVNPAKALLKGPQRPPR